MNRSVTAAAAGRPNCTHCGKPLRRASKDLIAHTGREYGLYADGIFCNASCGYLWACKQLGVPSALDALTKEEAASEEPKATGG